MIDCSCGYQNCGKPADYVIRYDEIPASTPAREAPVCQIHLRGSLQDNRDAGRADPSSLHCIVLNNTANKLLKRTLAQLSYSVSA